MSLSKWKELAAEKTKTDEMKQNLFDEITAEKGQRQQMKLLQRLLGLIDLIK